jgi:tetratricopeptide (TPR) repeat protein
VAKRKPKKTLAPKSESEKAFPIELDLEGIDETLKKVRDEVSRWANKGRYTRVRFKFRGKALLPDLPLAAVVAAEGLTFYWGGILRALIMNFAGGSLLEVELVNDSQKEVQRGREALLGGDIAEAKAAFEKAIDMDTDNAEARLRLGIVLKLSGAPVEARRLLEQAKALDENGPIAAEADKVLETLPTP